MTSCSQACRICSEPVVAAWSTSSARVVLAATWPCLVRLGPCRCQPTSITERPRLDGIVWASIVWPAISPLASVAIATIDSIAGADIGAVALEIRLRTHI
jgi:hypothetical protein